MCGIAGIFNYHQYNLEALKTSLRHRGPDEQNIFLENDLALVHTRLAIQDIHNGKQPFHYGDCTIIFNGEIYNHLALRQLLSNFDFQTQSDTETLLYLYLRFDISMFDLLDGMFAFCIYDRRKSCLIFARDRAGKKPLYYTNEGSSFIFASELNSIKCIKQLKINEEAIACYLRAGFIYGHYTAYQGVYTLPAGNVLRVTIPDRRLSITPYYDIHSSYSDNVDLSFSAALEQVEEKLIHSIKDRIMSSEMEVGAFLSGGIDSSLIVAIASQMKSKLQTFTVKFEGLYDESPLARLTAKKYQTNHSELEINLNLKRDVETILNAYGQPFMDSSAIPSYYVAKAAKERVTVVLNGDGGDELFGGYRRYVPFANKLIHFAKPFSFLQQILPAPKGKRSAYDFLYRLLSLASNKGLALYLYATSNIFEGVLNLKNNSIMDEMNDFVIRVFEDTKLTLLSKMLYLDFNLLLFADLLVKMDIATMQHALEARSPFLSRYMLDFVPKLEDAFKVNGWKTKYILRVLAKKYLPDQVIHQPKRGFEVPLEKWVAVDLKENIYDRLRPGCYAESYVGKEFIDKLLKNKNNIPTERRAKILWSLYCLETWYVNEISYR